MNDKQDTKPIPNGRTFALAVAIVIVVASPLAVAILISMNDEQRTPTGLGPAAVYAKTPISGGQEIEIVAITRTNCVWDEIAVQLSDGTNFAEWHTASADLDGGSSVTHDYGPEGLGSLTVFLNVTDVGGNGFVSGGDYIRVTTGGLAFSSGTIYAIYLVYEPALEKIGTGITFTG